MKYLYLLTIILFFSDCTSYKSENDYLYRDIIKLEKRISFIRYSLEQAEKEHPSSQRYPFIIHQFDLIEDVFQRIEIKLKEGDYIKKEIEIISEIIKQTSYSIDFAKNEIDDMIQYKFRNDYDELEKLDEGNMKKLSDLEITHTLKTIQEAIFNTYFTLSRTNKYTFNKVEIFPYSKGNGLKINQGDTLSVGLLSAAYDSSEVTQIQYWSKEDSDKKITQSGYQFLRLTGDRGKHEIEGKYILNSNNRKDTLSFEFSYTVE